MEITYNRAACFPTRSCFQSKRLQYVCVLLYGQWVRLISHILCIRLCYGGAISIGGLGTPPRLTFQTQLLHTTKRMSTSTSTSKGSSRRYLSKTALFSIGTLLVVEQSSLESRSRGCAKTPILTVYSNLSNPAGSNLWIFEPKQSCSPRWRQSPD